MNLVTKGLVVLKGKELLANIALPKKNRVATLNILNVSRDVVTYFWGQTSMNNVMNVVEAGTTNSSKELCSCGGYNGIYIYVYGHTHTHIQIYKHTYVRIQTYIHTYIHIYIPIYTHTYIH